MRNVLNDTDKMNIAALVEGLYDLPERYRLTLDKILRELEIDDNTQGVKLEVWKAEDEDVRQALASLDKKITERNVSGERRALEWAVKYREMKNARDLIAGDLIEKEEELEKLRKRLSINPVLRRGANWIERKGLQQFLAIGNESETCCLCNKHISRHYGGTEYRCESVDFISESAKKTMEANEALLKRIEGNK